MQSVYRKAEAFFRAWIVATLIGGSSISLGLSTNASVVVALLVLTAMYLYQGRITKIPASSQTRNFSPRQTKDLSVEISRKSIIDIIYGRYSRYEILKPSGGVFGSPKFYVYKDGKPYRGPFSSLQDAKEAIEKIEAVKKEAD